MEDRCTCDARTDHCHCSPFNDARMPMLRKHNVKTAGPLATGNKSKHVEDDSDWNQQSEKGVAMKLFGNQKPLPQIVHGKHDVSGGKDNEKQSAEPRIYLDPVHAVFNGHNPRDITVHVKLPVIDDIELELEEFSILRRLGNFKAAKAYFKEKLINYRHIPYVSVQYAQMLLDAGDFKALSRLQPQAVFGDEYMQGHGMIFTLRWA